MSGKKIIDGLIEAAEFAKDYDPRLVRFVAESNRIEGMLCVLPQEIEAHKTILEADVLNASALRSFVSIVQPGAVLRIRKGLDVRVGSHIAPPGGPAIGEALSAILERAYQDDDPYQVHQAYEHLHPFTDGNGRSGRALWLWMMLAQGHDPYVLDRGFLHTWYYQSLSANTQDGATQQK